jgi:hypothetical protein
MAATLSEEIEAAKKRKLSDTDDMTTVSQNVFKGLRVDRVLREDQRNKLITVLAKFPDHEHHGEKDAVILLERLPFDKKSVSEWLPSEDGKTLETLSNDIYSTHTVYSPRTIPGLCVDYDCQS